MYGDEKEGIPPTRLYTESYCKKHWNQQNMFII
jgi:hypothetical protein